MTVSTALAKEATWSGLEDSARPVSADRTPRLLTVPTGEYAAPTSLDRLWELYKTTGDRQARDRLILEYAPYAKRVAGHFGARVPPNVDQSDLISWGIIGLIDALDKFDPDRGVRFESYATSRITGAIVDALRSQDWVPRTVRRNTRAVNDARSNLEHVLRRTPTRAEVASELRTSEPRVDHMLAEASCGLLEPLERHPGPFAEGQRRRTPALTLADPSSNPAEEFDRLESESLLAEAIRSLQHRDRLIVVLSFYEGLTLAEIGSVLNVTESRVSQLRTRALEELRHLLSDTYGAER